MKHRVLLPAITALLALSWTATPAHAANADPQQARTSAAAISGDADALSALNAVNAHEIASAEIAQNKNVAAPVLEYAQMLHSEHSDNQRKTTDLARSRSLGINEDHPKVQKLQAEGKAERNRLTALQGNAFETAYLDAMIQGHAKALAMIDDELLPAATQAEVDRHLKDSRQHVAAHREQARKLKAQQR